MYTQYGNSKEGCYLPPDTYLCIFSVPDHPGYLLIWVTPPWNYPIWYDVIHLSGVYMCFSTQGRFLCLPKPYFSWQDNIVFVDFFIKIYNAPPCSPKYDCNIWLYSTLIEANFNGKGIPEPAPGCIKHIDPWLTFVSQVSSRIITIGSGTWTTYYRLWLGKEP